MNYYALLSVSNKSGIVDFAEGLIRAGYTLISSGGTHAAIQAEGEVYSHGLRIKLRLRPLQR